ncbi:MAG: methyltransferase domain-containing protein [Actinomycetota bacterium]|nr:methyltransferase domain-containing protein [Actinomycetota bacterium]
MRRALAGRDPARDDRAARPAGLALDWDAEVYDRVSDPQLAWGREVLERLDPRPDETVLDAGCGTGRLTELLVERLPRGRVIAVDASPAMVARARERLGQGVEVSEADLAELRLEEPVDAVFSNAVFHWIPDHGRLFRALHGALRPGGRLVAQCGGRGNVAALSEAIGRVSARPPFAIHLEGRPKPWTFAAPEEAAAALDAAGFRGVECWLEPKPVRPPSPRDYLATVTLGHHLEQLPGELGDDFVDAVAAELPEPLTLDYVRLNIEARRPW